LTVISPFQPCLPTRASRVPAGADWLHEVKHDGYRLIVQREGDRVGLFTLRGFDWSDRLPRISEAARRLRSASFVLDGEAVWLDPNGLLDFTKLRSRRHAAEISLVAFDLLAIGGDDIRSEPLHASKARLLAKSVNSIVSKRRDRPYRAGRSPDWVKVKNPQAPAALRVEDVLA
jgi:ATP-dependent DNA ligase